MKLTDEQLDKLELAAKYEDKVGDGEGFVSPKSVLALIDEVRKLWKVAEQTKKFADRCTFGEGIKDIMEALKEAGY